MGVAYYAAAATATMLPRSHCSPICMINDRFSLKVNSIRITSKSKAKLSLGHVLFFPLYNSSFSNKISLCFFPGKICTYFVIMPSTGRIFCLVLDEQAFSWACHGTITLYSTCKELCWQEIVRVGNREKTIGFSIPVHKKIIFEQI